MARQSVWSDPKVLELAGKFVPAADEVYRMQNLQTGTDPECRLFQKFAELGHYGGRPGTTRQGTYAATPSGLLLASINSNDPRRIEDMLKRALAKWQTLTRAERLLPNDPNKQWAAIKRPERFYPEDGLVLYVTSRDLPREAGKTQPAKGDWRANAWNLDYAWFTKAEARQFFGAKLEVGQKQDLPAPVIHRIACAHLVDNVRGQTAPFEESQVKKARLTTTVTAVDGNVVSLRLEGETLTAAEGASKHGLDMRLLGKATYDLTAESFLTFELVAIGNRWGATQNNSRRGDLDEAPIGLVFTLAGDSPCERVAPAFNQHRVYRPVVRVD
jgi:hypothetical protein